MSHIGEMAEDFEPAHGFEYFTDMEPVVGALLHPLRKRAYIEAVRGPVSAKDLAGRLDVPLQRMSYHVRLLADAGLLKVVRRTQRRGAMETHYRAVATLEFSDQAIAAASEETRATIMQADVRVFTEDLEHALSMGASNAPDYFLARAHFVVDDAGRERLAAELRRFHRHLEALERELRVSPGPGAHEINVIFGQYDGVRESGRHGPQHSGLSDDYDTIPP